MKLTDLRTGMRVVLRCDKRYSIVVIPNKVTAGFAIDCDKDYVFFYNYNNDFTYKDNETFDIVEVYDMPDDTSHALNFEQAGKLLWKEEEPIKMTLKEIEQKLGYKIRIV